MTRVTIPLTAAELEAATVSASSSALLPLELWARRRSTRNAAACTLCALGLVALLLSRTARAPRPLVAAFHNQAALADDTALLWLVPSTRPPPAAICDRPLDFAAARVLTGSGTAAKLCPGACGTPSSAAAPLASATAIAQTQLARLPCAPRNVIDGSTAQLRHDSAASAARRVVLSPPPGAVASSAVGRDGSLVAVPSGAGRAPAPLVVLVPPFRAPRAARDAYWRWLEGQADGPAPLMTVAVVPDTAEAAGWAAGLPARPGVVIRERPGRFSIAVTGGASVAVTTPTLAVLSPTNVTLIPLRGRP